MQQRMSPRRPPRRPRTEMPTGLRDAIVESLRKGETEERRLGVVKGLQAAAAALDELASNPEMCLALRADPSKVLHTVADNLRTTSPRSLCETFAKV